LQHTGIRAPSRGLIVKEKKSQFLKKRKSEKSEKRSMAAENNFVQPAIPKFDGHYDHWSMLMENFLRSKEYWSLVETGIPAVAEGVELTEAQQKSIADQKLKDLKIKNYLFQAIDRTIMETILNRDTAKHIWDSMKQKYQGSTRVKRAQLQALRKEFEVLQMKEG